MVAKPESERARDHRAIWCTGVTHDWSARTINIAEPRSEMTYTRVLISVMEEGGQLCNHGWFVHVNDATLICLWGWIHDSNRDNGSNQSLGKTRACLSAIARSYDDAPDYVVELCPSPNSFSFLYSPFPLRIFRLLKLTWNADWILFSIAIHGIPSILLLTRSRVQISSDILLNIQKFI